MIGLDTNILIRFFLKDDPEQSKRANDILSEKCTANQPGFITTIVLVELVWVLRSCYGYKRTDIAKVLEQLICAKEIRFEYPDAVQYAYRLYTSGAADFADALIGNIGLLNGCDKTVTFDSRAARMDEFFQV